jgi:hypothetical protein
VSSSHKPRAPPPPHSAYLSPMLRRRPPPRPFLLRAPGAPAGLNTRAAPRRAAPASGRASAGSPGCGRCGRRRRRTRRRRTDGPGKEQEVRVRENGNEWVLGMKGWVGKARGRHQAGQLLSLLPPSHQPPPPPSPPSPSLPPTTHHVDVAVLHQAPGLVGRDRGLDLFLPRLSHQPLGAGQQVGLDPLPQLGRLSIRRGKNQLR